MKIYILSLLSFLTIIYAVEVLNNSQSKYKRDNWYHWNKNISGCKNLRHFLLENTSLEPVSYYTDKECRVNSGKWYGSYTDIFFYHSSQLDIDHVVPLSWAASHGAIKWSKKKKRQFANDIDNLIPVSRAENRKKGALGPEKYLPPNQKFHCDYIGKFKNIVSKYELNLDKKEVTVLKRLTDSCN
jgi:hypothetical protein